MKLILACLALASLAVLSIQTDTAMTTCQVKHSFSTCLEVLN